jgi:recombination protein RecR
MRVPEKLYQEKTYIITMDQNNNFLKLIQYFEEFPGVGSRQAKRFTYFLMNKNSFFIKDFTETILNVKQVSRQCSSCMRFFFGDGEFCSICSSEERNTTQLLLVEKDQDVDSFEKTKSYTGTYFVIGRLLSLISKEDIKLARLAPLYEKLKNKDSVNEIILAFSNTPNGNFTDSYIRQEITKQFPAIAIKSLGRGFATGSDPEYVDNDTLSNALKNRA